MRNKERQAVPDSSRRWPGDDVIRDEIGRALASDPALAECGWWPPGHAESARMQILSPEGVGGRVSLEVSAGVVRLEGEVPSLSHKRLAGVLAQRVPGCRQLLNLLVARDDRDSEETLANAVRLAVARIPGVDPAHVRVRARGQTILLDGMVFTPQAAVAVERDARNVLGVDTVENRLQVEPPLRGKA